MCIISRCYLLTVPKYAVKIYIYRANFEVLIKALEFPELFNFSAPNLAWMINDHLVTNITQYFNFLPSQRYLKVVQKFILTVANVVYNAVISDWLTLTKTFSINSTHSWRKNQPTQGSVQIWLYWFSWQAPKCIVKSVLSDWCTKGILFIYNTNSIKRKEDQHFIYKKLQIQLFFFFFLQPLGMLMKI